MHIQMSRSPSRSDHIQLGPQCDIEVLHPPRNTGVKKESECGENDLCVRCEGRGGEGGEVCEEEKCLRRLCLEILEN